MTVLPYVTMSIVSGLGALDPRRRGRSASASALVIALLWALALARSSCSR